MRLFFPYIDIDLIFCAAKKIFPDMKKPPGGKNVLFFLAIVDNFCYTEKKHNFF